MNRISSEQELLECFRLLDRDEVEIPRSIQFPLNVKDYFSWIEPSGARAYLLFPDGEQEQLKGIVFRRGPVGTPPVMCEWCHSVGAGEIGLLTATASSNRRVGLHLCRNLDCKEKASSTPGINDLPEGLDADEKIRRITARMSDFSRKHLF